MKRETKIISILASAVFAISSLFLIIPDLVRSNNSFDSRSDEFSDWYSNNTAYMFGFGSTTVVSFEQDLDEDMFLFLSDVYNKFTYLDNLGSVTEVGSGYNNVFDINNSSLDTKVEINLELHTILTETKKLHEYSEGIFDVTSGKIYDEVSGFIDNNIPMDIDNIVTGFGVDFDDRLLLESENGKYYATRVHEDTKVELGGYLKGYFTEYARARAGGMFSNNEREIFIDSGSSSMTYIGEEDKNITVGTPRANETHPGRWINQNNYHMATSGDEAQYRCTNGNIVNNCYDSEIVHHLVDPRDGTFIQDRGRVSTITNKYAPFMDAISSILFIADDSLHESIMANFSEYEIDYMYTVIKPDSREFDVFYKQSTSEVKFEISPEYVTGVNTNA